MSGTIYSIIPPIIALLMVVLTRKVLLSLGVGIVSAAVVLHGKILLNDGIGAWLQNIILTIWNSFKAVFVSEGALNTWNVYIILFLFLLGIITAFISISGGSRAFGEWAQTKVKTRTGAQLLAAVLGIIIFIDDYFNALAVGQVSRPITDRNKVSRAKLAYIIDSTSAPICVVSPISSWGAYIIAIIAPILVTHGISEVSPLSAFIQIIPMNLYVVSAMLMVIAVAVFNINIGSMRVHENRAMTTGEVMDPQKPVLGELKQELPQSEKGSVGDLVWPIMALVIGTVGSLFWTGYKASEGNVTIFSILENTDVTGSLLYGGLFGIMITVLLFLVQVYAKNAVSISLLPKGIIEGIKSMLPAVYILLFAWVIVDLIGQIETGKYLAGLVEKSNINIAFLPVILFVVAGIMAFATGTSWGTFGMMLPIAGDIVAASDLNLMLPALAAVLAGSVFGDHCSPISDTTILSSTGAGSHLIDHVITQLPYAIISAVFAAIGYVVLGLTGNTMLGLLTTVVLFVLFVITIINMKKA
ncbi:Na+/H+ antiporter NhaC family protein [Fredinandcohnia sp. QZ13]|uniref:Na+/H+ antiporter NhaC family protein n=1 Tax=Fredinandcohnia sp. QZ13 TaxID=3073144 RepID=UPI0028531D06|nr:Na+/H+ antiporter NhaC family protein [Fredinandcohnia sp. QZ13]MDR4889433.1 Na+/H+ antiporter NhaC family protein [Fredinandcohnia sp. QZ13]